MLDLLLELLPRRHVGDADPGRDQRRGGHLRRRPVRVRHRHHLPDAVRLRPGRGAHRGDHPAGVRVPVRPDHQRHLHRRHHQRRRLRRGGPAEGLAYQETTPGGAVTTSLYYADGDLAQVTDPDGRRTVYGYDELGRKASQTVYSDAYPSGLATTYAYDANGELATETDPPVTDRVTGPMHTEQTTTSYDSDGERDLAAVDRDLTGGDASRTVTSTYNAVRQARVGQTDAAGAKTIYTYDAYGNKASETDPDGNVTDYAYDGDGHLLTTTLENYTGSPPGSQAAGPAGRGVPRVRPAGRLGVGERRDGPDHRVLVHRQRAAGGRAGEQPRLVAVVHVRGGTPTTAPAT